jgi:hypothetical protein
MKGKIFLKFLFFTIIFFFLFYFRNLVLADSWTEYKCQGTGCSDDALYRICDETSCQPEAIFQDCQSWQICKNGLSWSTSTIPACQCSGSCLAIPSNPSPSNGAQDILLPVTLSWNVVNGTNSYRYRIEGVLENYTANNSVAIDEAGNCLLKSNTTYSWGVQACCNSDGTNCGSWSSWTFKTGLTSQLLSPKNNATDVSIPVTLDWCDVENAQSYYVQIYKDGEVYWPDLITKTNGTLNSSVTHGFETFTKSTSYQWEVAVCLNENGTKCGTNCNNDQQGEECADYSQRWSLTTTAGINILPPERIAPFYDPNQPDKVPVVNLSNFLEWKSVLAAHSYRYEIKKDSTVITDSATTSLRVNLSSINPLWDSADDFDKIYTWRVKSCWDDIGNQCEANWSEPPWKFKTTGAKPTTLNADNTIIPVKLDWNDVSGSASYKYEVSSDSSFAADKIVATGVVETSETSIDYPNLVQDTDYWWHIRTCADKTGDVCGEWSNSQSFKTFKLGIPSNPRPNNGDKLFTYDKYISWSPVVGARAYQYTIDYVELSGEEKNEKCPGLVGTKVILPTITYSSSVLLSLECLGKYHWSVRACLDKNCQETGDWSGPWLFNFVQPTPVGKAGLVPCGRTIDYPETPWNEREPCQFKHIFILLKNIIDLLLWRIGLMILVLLAIATGVVYYFSMGAPTTMAKVKSILKSAGMGYAIIFLAWIIINLILSILGYKIGIFGKWWILSF